jgi:hypothetical protein
MEIVSGNMLSAGLELGCICGSSPESVGKKGR